MADEVRKAGGPTAGGPPTATQDEAIAGSQEDEQPAPSIPAGEPEAPVAPAPPEEPGPSSGDGPPEGEREELAEDHEAKLEHDLEELSAKAQKADEYLELAQRTKADFENYRKRAAREVGTAQERGVVKLARELLPAVDNLDRALAAAEDDADGDELMAGIKLVHAEVLAALARVGVERFDPQGERFDPECHEAVAQQAVDGADTGTVVEVYQRGYRLGETVIRPARVLVAG